MGGLDCRNDFVVAFSCKGRGFCPSCAARRMTVTAARWADRLLPAVAWRQWALALPWSLRPRLSWDAGLLTGVLSIFQQSMASRLRVLARRRGLRGGEHASVSVVQRFGSALNLNVHIHALVAEGLWVEDAGGVRFEALRVTQADVDAVVATVCRRVGRLLARRGLVEEGCTPSAEVSA